MRKSQFTSKLIQEDKTMESKKIYETEDLPLATWLVIAGYPMLKSPAPDPTRKNKLLFIFEWTEGLEEAVLSFNNKTARVDPLSFATMFRQMKAYSLQKQSQKSGGYYGGRNKE